LAVRPQISRNLGFIAPQGISGKNLFSTEKTVVNAVFNCFPVVKRVFLDVPVWGTGYAGGRSGQLLALAPGP